MDFSREVIKDLIASMGIKKFQMKSNSFVFEFKNKGDLHIDIAQDKILIYLTKKVKMSLIDNYENALSFVHYKNSDVRFSMHAGLGELSEIFFLAVVRKVDFNISLLEEIIDSFLEFSLRLN